MEFFMTSDFADYSQIVFVDPRVADWQSLIADLPAGARVVLLDPEQDGVQTMGLLLAGVHGLDSIHIISHGSEANAFLGTADLSAATVDSYAEALAGIGHA